MLAVALAAFLSRGPGLEMKVVRMKRLQRKSPLLSLVFALALSALLCAICVGEAFFLQRSTVPVAVRNTPWRFPCFSEKGFQRHSIPRVGRGWGVCFASADSEQEEGAEARRDSDFLRRVAKALLLEASGVDVFPSSRNLLRNLSGRLKRQGVSEAQQCALLKQLKEERFADHHQRWSDLAAGVSTEETVCLWGRVASIR